MSWLEATVAGCSTRFWQSLLGRTRVGGAALRFRFLTPVFRKDSIQFSSPTPPDEPNERNPMSRMNPISTQSDTATAGGWWGRGIRWSSLFWENGPIFAAMALIEGTDVSHHGREGDPGPPSTGETGPERSVPKSSWPRTPVAVPLAKSRAILNTGLIPQPFSSPT